jgi:dihydroorotate dehydrogenase electron transfer subunit
MIGIRGSYGNGFSLSGKVLCIGGGVGLAPLRMIASSGNEVLYLIGGRTHTELLYLEEFLSNPDVTVQTATDDGSRGHHGFVTELIAQVQPALFDSICVCGPEKMMLNAYLALKEAGAVERAQFSMHRYMKCGAGVCGSCCMDPFGFRVCGDGPVFCGLDLGDEEFGIYHRDASGRRVYE